MEREGRERKGEIYGERERENKKYRKVLGTKRRKDERMTPSKYLVIYLLYLTLLMIKVITVNIKGFN